jgi:iron complex outermembrane receptor protein
MIKMRRWGVVVVGGGWVLALAQEGGGSASLYTTPLEELMQIKVITPAKHPEALMDTPSAVHIISGEDIRRSGATSLPDAMRLAPGMTVSRIDLSRWAVSMRGFHGQYAKHLLVMIDGRSIYTPLFSGVTWSLEDVMLEDVERIEVVRGPGAASWGANAVNGVINVITKSSADTQGGLATFGVGSVEEVFGSLRYGGQLNPSTTYRVYLKAFERGGFVDEDGEDTPSSWDQVRGGFRLDGEPSAWDAWTLQGDLYQSQPTIAARPASPAGAETLVQEADNVGGNLLGTWHRVLNDTDSWTVRSYYDRVDRDFLPSFSEVRDTVDLDMQHSFALTENQQLTWGGGYRYIREDNTSGQFLTFDPEETEIHQGNVFVEDMVRLLDDRLHVTAGAKLEYHDFMDEELQPHLRALYKLTGRQSVWAAVSRAVRVPTRVEYEGRYLLDIAVEDGKPVYLTIVGNDEQVPEELIAYEVGYRALPTDRVSVDATAYYYDYDKLVSAEPGPDRPPATPGGPVVRPLFADNKNEGEGYGGEAVVRWIANDWASFELMYSLARLHLRNTDGGRDTVALLNEGKTPQHQASLRAMLEVAPSVSLDTWVRYVDPLTELEVPSYWEVDAQVTWRIRPDLELAVVGQNLIDDQHGEFRESFLNGLRTEVPRSVYGKVTWMF